MSVVSEARLRHDRTSGCTGCIKHEQRTIERLTMRIRREFLFYTLLVYPSAFFDPSRVSFVARAHAASTDTVKMFTAHREFRTRSFHAVAL